MFKRWIGFFLLLAIPQICLAQDEKPVDLGEVIITAPPMIEPLTVKTDPKAPRQPIPANDGGNYLKNIPGFSVTRKGGTSGDPLLRGMGGSRINVLLDGEYLLGGCGGRMDAPTQYVFPESYDEITVIKGPQTLQYGGGNVAGVVLFDRKTKRFDAPGIRGTLSALYGSYDRNDQLIDVAGGDKFAFIRLIGTRSDSNDYKDGDGNRIHSFYTRDSLTGILGITPDEDTRLELTYDSSQAEAAYADRAMDGTRFDREGYSVKFEKDNISSFVKSINLLAYYNYIDHVMDNFSLRTPSGARALTNPDRETKGYRAKTELTPFKTLTITAGFDYETDERTTRSGVNYNATNRVPDMNFRRSGVFGEAKFQPTDDNRIIGGTRLDYMYVRNPRSGTQPDDYNKLHSSFARYEHDFMDDLTSYIGIGRAERAADWWERSKVFYLKPEKSLQTDAGVIYNGSRVRSSLSAFYANIEDYILVANDAPTARNIDARMYGAEAEVAYSPIDFWTASASAAYVRGENKTYNTPLPQTPPLSAVFGLKYDDKTYLAGLIYRVVSKQERVDAGRGNIIGTDVGPTGGFSVLSANAGYRPVENLLLSAGIDNIFDKKYAEHINKAGSSSVTAMGLTQTDRVNEPGRTLWIKVSYNF